MTGEPLVLVTTESGSMYWLNRETMTWTRRAGPGAAFTRTGDGTLLEWPTLEIGQRMLLKCPPLTAGSKYRVISTTPVVRIQRG